MASEDRLVVGAPAGAGTAVLERLEAGIPLSDQGAFPGGGVEDPPDDPVATYELAATLLSVFRPAQARPLLELLDRQLGEADHWLAARIRFLWALHDIEWADPRAGIEHGRAALRALGPGRVPPPLPPGVMQSHPWVAYVDSAIPLVLPGLLCRGYTWLEDYSSAHESLAEVAHRSDVAEALAVQVPLSILFCREGRLTDAATAARRALAGADRVTSRAPAVLFGAHQTLCLVHCERDLLVEAEEHLDEEMRTVGLLPADLRWHATALLDAVELRRAGGDHEEAERLLAAVERIDRTEPLPGHLARRLLRARVLHLLDEGDAEGAAAALSRASGPRPAVLQARVDLAAGRPERAAARLRGAVPPVRGWWQAIERLVVLARTELACGDRRRAVGCLSAALEMGRGDGYVRSFTAEGAELATLLAGLDGPFPDPYVEELVTRTTVHVASGPTGGEVLSEVLTGREREILRRLTTHLTQQEIAAELYVSVNTLKTHLKSLYRKLGVARRSEAVDVARSMGLFRPSDDALLGGAQVSQRSA